MTNLDLSMGDVNVPPILTMYVGFACFQFHNSFENFAVCHQDHASQPWLLLNESTPPSAIADNVLHIPESNDILHVVLLSFIPWGENPALAYETYAGYVLVFHACILPSGTTTVNSNYLCCGREWIQKFSSHLGVYHMPVKLAKFAGILSVPRV